MPSSPEAAAVVVAGGAGRRFGGAVRKQYLEVGGEPVLLRAVRAFLGHPRIGAVVVVLPAEDAATPPSWLAALPVHVVAGGAERGDSVYAGLRAVPAEVPRVLVHDGARPFVSRALVDRVLDGCAKGGGAIAALPAAETVKEVGEDGIVTATPDRARLWLAQTPQGFPLGELLDAYERARGDGTPAPDDAAVYERGGGTVRVVAGERWNLKVTVPDDLTLAAAIAAATA